MISVFKSQAYHMEVLDIPCEGWALEEHGQRSSIHYNTIAP